MEILKVSSDDWLYIAGIAGFMLFILFVVYLSMSPSVEEDVEMIRNTKNR